MALQLPPRKKYHCTRGSWDNGGGRDWQQASRAGLPTPPPKCVTTATSPKLHRLKLRKFDLLEPNLLDALCCIDISMHVMPDESVNLQLRHVTAADRPAPLILEAIPLVGSARG